VEDFIHPSTTDWGAQQGGIWNAPSTCAVADMYDSCASHLGVKILIRDKLMLLAGIGPEAAALCTTYITECASLVKDFIYLGTSGWSAQQGGILNAPSSCAAANGISPRNRESSPPLRRGRKSF